MNAHHPLFHERNRVAIERLTNPTPSKTVTLRILAPIDITGRPRWLPETPDEHLRAVWRECLRWELRVAKVQRPITEAVITIIPGPTRRDVKGYAATVELVVDELRAPSTVTYADVDRGVRPGLVVQLTFGETKEAA